jgi:hypothetical protein
MRSKRQDTVRDRAKGPAQVVALGAQNSVSADTRMIAFIRLVARQAARDYHEQTRRDAEHRDD